MKTLSAFRLRRFWLLLLLAYLLGSLSFAVLLSRLFGTRDPRHDGSGNPGASNMLRLAGRKLALLTLAGDLSKSLIRRASAPSTIALVSLPPGRGRFASCIRKGCGLEPKIRVIQAPQMRVEGRTSALRKVLIGLVRKVQLRYQRLQGCLMLLDPFHCKLILLDCLASSGRLAASRKVFKQ